MIPTVRIDNVTKSFGGLVALSNVSATIEPGVTALLGPNGAGKSTLFRVIAGLAKPDSGTVTTLGGDLRSDPAIRARVGLVPQQDALFERMTGADFVRLGAQLNAIANPDAAAQRVLEYVDMTSAADRRLRTYSKGMRQRIKIASALVARPEVLVLDEPLNGLDPVERERMIELFRSYGGDGNTVIISSHVLAEVAEIGSEVLIIVDGRLAAAGNYHELRRLMNDRPQQVWIGTDRARDFAAELVRHGYADGVNVSGDAITATTHNIDQLGRQVAAVAHAHQFALDRFEILDDSLEAVFDYLTQQPFQPSGRGPT